MKFKLGFQFSFVFFFFCFSFVRIVYYSLSVFSLDSHSRLFRYPSDPYVCRQCPLMATTTAAAVVATKTMTVDDEWILRRVTYWTVGINVTSLFINFVFFSLPFLLVCRTVLALEYYVHLRACVCVVAVIFLCLLFACSWCKRTESLRSTDNFSVSTIRIWTVSANTSNRSESNYLINLFFFSWTAVNVSARIIL